MPLIPEVTMNQVFGNSFPTFECRVCALESVREDDIETARSKVAQRILEICRRLRLRQCGLNIQILPDLLRPLKCRRIPGCIARRARREQCDFESRSADGGRSAGMTARGDTKHYYQCELRTCRLEESPQSTFRQNYTSHAFSCSVDYQSREG